MLRLNVPLSVCLPPPPPSLDGFTAPSENVEKDRKKEEKMKGGIQKEGDRLGGG